MDGQALLTIILVLAVLVWLVELVWLYKVTQDQRLDPIRTVSGAAIFFVAAAPVARMSPSIVDRVGGVWESVFASRPNRRDNSPASRPSSSHAPARLLIDGNQKSLTIPRIRLGRYPNNEIAIDNSTVSAYHAEVVQRPDGRHEIVDLESRNGTRVNGAIVRSQVLKDGDLVTLGGASMHYLAPSLADPQVALAGADRAPESAPRQDVEQYDLER